MHRTILIQFVNYSGFASFFFAIFSYNWTTEKESKVASSKISDLIFCSVTFLHFNSYLLYYEQFANLAAKFHFILFSMYLKVVAITMLFKLIECPKINSCFVICRRFCVLQFMMIFFIFFHIIHFLFPANSKMSIRIFISVKIIVLLTVFLFIYLFAEKSGHVLQ